MMDAKQNAVLEPPWSCGVSMLQLPYPAASRTWITRVTFLTCLCAKDTMETKTA